MSLLLPALSQVPAAAATGRSQVARAAASLTGPQGYRLAASDGGVFDFGDAGFLGNPYTENIHGRASYVGMAATEDGLGYWLAAADGGVFGFGDSVYHGSIPALGVALRAPITAIARTSSGGGYWLVGSDGSVFAFGDAPFAGSLLSLGVHPAGPIVGIAPSPSGRGYWLVGSDGSVFAFGDAPFLGSLPGLHIKPSSPVVGIAQVSPAGDGYWLASADGGVYAFGSAAFYGSVGTIHAHLNAPIVSIGAVIPGGGGYWLAGADGGVFTFGSALFVGNIYTVGPPVTGHLRGPIVGIVPGHGVFLPGTPGPSVTAVTPPSGADSGHNLVTISGLNLTGASVVMFGNARALAFTVVNDQTISAAVPPGMGTVDVIVTTPTGVSATSPADQYGYTPAPATPYSGARLVLGPGQAGPDVPHTSQSLTATLTTRDGKPLPHMMVGWSVSGANAASGTADTDATGTATFSYTGVSPGTDIVTATYAAGRDQAVSNPSTVVWQLPSTGLSPITVSPVTGQFFRESTGSAQFTASPAGPPPDFAETFPDIEFNPPFGAVPHDTSGVSPATRPFTDVTTDGLGNATGRSTAEGNGLQAGVGPLAAFDAVLEGSFQVTAAGTQILELFRSDGFVLGVGGGASGGANNTLVNPPNGNVTPFAGLPVAASDNQLHTDSGPAEIDLNFPAAGSYPFELDYLSRSAANGNNPMTLALTTQSKVSGLSVSFGYADTTSVPATGTMPAPWRGDSGVSFVGDAGPYDTGAIQLHNNTASAIPLDGVTVDIGPHHFDPWAGQSLSVPGNQTLVLTGTGTSLDTSEAAHAGTGSFAAGQGFNFTVFASQFPNNGIGPVGMAQDPKGDFYALDFANATLYEFGPAGGPAGQAKVLASYGGEPVGLAFSLDYRHLYLALRSAGQLVEIDPTTGAILRTVANIGGVNAIAPDPVSGDLVTDSINGAVSFVAGADTASPTVSTYSLPANTDGMAVGPDGTVYADCCGDGFFEVAGASSAQPGQVLATVQSPQLFGTDGLALLPPPPGSAVNSVVQNSNNGVVFEIDDPGGPNQTVRTIYSGGTRGDFVTVGADGCLYASQSDTILKGTAADGSCPFLPFACPASSVVPQVHVTVAGQASTFQDTGLALTSGGVDGDHCGGTNESVNWTPPGAAPPSGPPVPPGNVLTLSPAVLGDQVLGTRVSVTAQALLGDGQPSAGTPVTLTVSGPNAQTVQATTDGSGLAVLSYTGTDPGVDSLQATAAMAGGQATSNIARTGWFAPQTAPTPSSTSSGTAPPAITGISPANGETVSSPHGVSAVITAPVYGVATWAVSQQTHGANTPVVIGSGTGVPPPTLATFDPTALAPGQYDITITATSNAGGTATATVTVTVGPPPPPPPAVLVTGPADGATVTAAAPVTATVTPPSGTTIASWSVIATSQAPGGVPVTLATGTGAPPSTLATFDPTLVPDGTYTITVTATTAAGATGTGSVAVSVAGALKLGRYTVDYEDLSVPVNGLQLSVQRHYDSTDKRVGDFGVGWHLALSDIEVTNNRALGAGGWSQYDPACFGALCLTAYRSAVPHFVTVKWPDGHADQFDFTPTGGSVLFPTIGPAFTARPGTTSTLTTNAPIGGMTADGDLVDPNGNPYDPSRFQLTTHDGRVFALDRTLGLIAETDPSGNTVTVDAAGVHASNGPSLTFTRDTAQRITDVNGPASQHMHYDYSSSGDLADVVDTAGNTSGYTYDAAHDLTGATGPDARPLATLTYDSAGRLTSITDGDGRVTTLADDTGTRQQTVVAPNGTVTVESFDDLGDVLSVRATAQGQTVGQSATYDTVGRPLTLTDPAGGVTTLTYDSDGNPITSTDPLGRTQHASYTAGGQPIETTGPEGQVLHTWQYDASGHLVAAGDGLGDITTYNYDATGHPTQVVDPTGLATTATYDPASGYPTAIGTPAGTHASVVYDALGRPTSSTSPGGATTSTGYDASGAIASLTDGDGHTRTFGHDGFGRTVTATDAEGQTTNLAYDPSGRLQTVTDPDGQTLTYGYDSGGLLRSVSATDGQSYTAQHDPFGRLVSATNSTGTLSWTYDAAGRILSESSTAPVAVTTQYTYDADGERIGLSGPSGTVGYGYDDLGQLISLTNGSGTILFGYDAAGRRTGIAWPDGLTETAAYDGGGRTIGETVSHGAEFVDRVQLAYDHAGHLATASDVRATTTYSYDADGHLLSAVHTPPGVLPDEHYTYDAAGNRLTVSGGSPWTYTADNAVLTTPGASYTYNGEGQRTSQTTTSSPATTSYTWDAFGQLARVTTPAGATTYSYDALGRVVSASGPSGSTQYAYDGDQPVATFSAGQPSASALTTLEGTPISQSGTGDVVTDRQGSVLATGTGSPVTAYSAFGVDEGPAPAGPFGFLGRSVDPATGLVRDGARTYDPSVGQFITRDPVSAYDMYGYAAGDPTDLSDPSGAQLISSAFQYQLAQTIQGALQRCVSGIFYAAVSEILTDTALGMLGRHGPLNGQGPGVDTVASAVTGACLGGAMFNDEAVKGSVSDLNAHGMAFDAAVGAVALGMLMGFLAGAMGAAAGAAVCGQGPDEASGPTVAASMLVSYSTGAVSGLATVADAASGARLGLRIGMELGAAVAVGGGIMAGVVDATAPPSNCPNVG